MLTFSWGSCHQRENPQIQMQTTPPEGSQDERNPPGIIVMSKWKIIHTPDQVCSLCWKMYWYYCGSSLSTRAQRQPQLNQCNMYNAIQRYRSGTIHRQFYFLHDTGHDVKLMMTPLSSIRMVSIYLYACRQGFLL